MSLGRRRREQQDTFWVSADRLGSGPRNAFYDRLNRLLAEIDFDRKLEQAAEPFYESTGRRSLPPGVYFRMIIIGYFEDISSQRGIAWRCEDSRSLARFLGYQPGESTPDHSTLSVTRERLPMEIHELAFELILAAAKDHGLLKGKTVGVDATDLEANASMKSIVRKDNGDDWREYLRKLYEEETGISDPDDDELRRFDKRRKSKKKVSNEDWESKTDPDSRIGKMKDGRFHLKYKAENAVDLESEVIVAAEVYHGNAGDTSTIEDTVNTAQTRLRAAGTECEIKEVVADKGYHGEETLDALQTNRTSAPTFRNPIAREIGLGRTRVLVVNHPTVAIAATRLAIADVGYSVFAANGLNGRSLTCVILVAVAGLGFAGSGRSASDTCRPRWRTTWGASCAH